MSDTILQTMLVTVIQVMLPVVLGALVLLIKEQVSKIKANADQEKLNFAIQMARQLVLAAEQNGLTGAIKGEAAAKKQWVLERLEMGLATRGITLDMDELSDLIEAQLMDAFNFYKASE